MFSLSIVMIIEVVVAHFDTLLVIILVSVASLQSLVMDFTGPGIAFTVDIVYYAYGSVQIK